ncbi:MAG: ATPase [Candidatus Cloacimonetes bacterium]|nr:ATPase [Candidatus Cloacimonadota bacterium]
MPITDVRSNPENLTLTVTAEYPVPVERLWEAFADPRQLEKFWGPEAWPATFTRHELVPGGQSRYYMTGPDGTRAGGWFRFVSVDPYRSFELEDGFSNDDGTPNESMPTIHMAYTFSSLPNGGSTFTSVATFPSLEAMEQLAAMGMVEGMRSALGQLDDVLADLAAFAASLPTAAKILNDTQVRIARVIRGSVEDVWRAHHEPELLKRWMLGPDGWTMPVCELANEVGGRYRYEWENEDGTERFGFEGEVLELEAPYREVTSERMIGMEGEGAINELTLTPVGAGTLLTIVITYPSAEVRDTVLGTGMVDGMEQSYARLEETVLAPAAA